MSTNYYWYVDIPRMAELPTGVVVDIEIDRYNPDIHIGKRSGNGFIWAQNEDTVIDICNKQSNSYIIESEYGDPITGGEFIEIVNGQEEWSTSLIGERFS